MTKNKVIYIQFKTSKNIDPSSRINALQKKLENICKNRG